MKDGAEVGYKIDIWKPHSLSLWQQAYYYTQAKCDLQHRTHAEKEISFSSGSKSPLPSLTRDLQCVRQVHTSILIRNGDIFTHTID